MADKKPSKLDEVNATLDRFAKLIEENARQSRENEAKAEARAEAKAKKAEARAEAKAKKAEARAEAKAKKAEAEAKRRQEERDRQQAEDRAKDEKRQAEWEKRQAEWEKGMADLRDQVGGQANSIGEITEAMTISDNIIELVNEFGGLSVTHFDFNVRKKYQTTGTDGRTILRNYQIDGLVYGPEVAIVIEAKTTLSKKYVEKFIDKLTNFKLAYPDYQHKTLYGAVAFVRDEGVALDVAEQYGLFLIKASPPDVELINKKGLKPIKIT